MSSRTTLLSTPVEENEKISNVFDDVMSDLVRQHETHEHPPIQTNYFPQRATYRVRLKEGN